MINKAYGLIAAIALVGLIAGVAVVAVEQAKREAVRAAVEAERRERMADAIELIRESDKALDVFRKATDPDLCRGMGGKTVEGVCQ